jgi:hypothetical protein
MDLSNNSSSSSPSLKSKQVTSGIDIMLSTMYKQTFAEEK